MKLTNQATGIFLMFVTVVGNACVTSVEQAANVQTMRAPSTPVPPPKTLLPPADAWGTQQSRDILGAFFIKPYLRQWLKDPDSLQDFQVISASPVKRKSGAFRVTVFYRARNSFGALVPERRTVTMVYNPTDEDRPWVMLAHLESEHI